MKKHLEIISAKNDLDFYFNEKNIPNQDLVFMTFDYFENGKGKGFFQPLEILNLIWQQNRFIRENKEKPVSSINHLKGLPLMPRELHTLLGFILLWNGGYPVDFFSQQENTMYRFIEREFLAYPDETPEKSFCQKNWVRYKRERQIEEIINNNLSGIKTELDSETPQTLKPQFKTSDKKGTRIDLIRIFSALNDLRYVEKLNGQLPTKKDFIEAVGEFLGTDFSTFQQDLSQAFKNGSIESNVEIFEKLKNITIEAKNKSEEKNK
uniref:hypothetical protein n=1 Tax=Algoriphagus sp. TaxID=1872435 RepID=UPI004047BA7D